MIPVHISCSCLSTELCGEEGPGGRLNERVSKELIRAFPAVRVFASGIDMTLDI